MEELTRSREAYDAPVDALVAEGNEVEGDRWRCDKEGITPTCGTRSTGVLSVPEAYEVAYRESQKV